jgi:hypothetical protein
MLIGIGPVFECDWCDSMSSQSQKLEFWDSTSEVGLFLFFYFFVMTCYQQQKFKVQLFF